MKKADVPPLLHSALYGVLKTIKKKNSLGVRGLLGMLDKTNQSLYTYQAVIYRR